MKIKGAMTILNKRAEFYGKTFDELINLIDSGLDETLNVLTAYEIYKIDQGFVWCGVNGVGFTTPEDCQIQWKLQRGEGHQLELDI
jgi:hypothetical protein